MWWLPQENKGRCLRQLLQTVRLCRREPGRWFAGDRTEGWVYAESLAQPVVVRCLATGL